MIFHGVLAGLAGLIISIINTTGELGVFLLMLFGSANVPIPSEVTLPFAGFAVSRGAASFWLVVLAGTAGDLAGSAISYWIGRLAGRPALERWGKYFFIGRSSLERGDRYFQKYGVKIAFWSRLVPIVRAFASLPAGINRAPFAPFAALTFAGSFLWSALLTWLGFFLGERWGIIGPYFGRVSFVIVGFIILVVVMWIWQHIKDRPRLKP